jgi:hypothetical protein
MNAMGGDDGGVIKVERVGVPRKSISSSTRERLNRFHLNTREVLRINGVRIKNERKSLLYRRRKINKQ